MNDRSFLTLIQKKNEAMLEADTDSGTEIFKMISLFQITHGVKHQRMSNSRKGIRLSQEKIFHRNKNSNEREEFS